MKKINFFLLGISLFMTFVFVSCSKESAKTATTSDKQPASVATMIAENGSNPDESIMTATTTGTTVLTATNSVEEHKGYQGHYLYSESNEAGVNQIYV